MTMARNRSAFTILLVLSFAIVSLVGCGAGEFRKTEAYYLVAANTRLPYWHAAKAGLLKAAVEIGVGAAMVGLDSRRVATGKDFDDAGQLKTDVAVLDQAGAEGLAESLMGRELSVSSRESRPYRRRPSAPFITSTLQQEAGRKLGFSSARTMRAAQRLYENGFITYMRTDSTTLSADALTTARNLITEKYGSANVPDKARTYVKKVKNAQEAHESIRPAGDNWRSEEHTSELQSH